MIKPVKTELDYNREEHSSIEPKEPFPLASKEDLANAKVDIIRWVFGFFVVLILSVIGLYFKH